MLRVVLGCILANCAQMVLEGGRDLDDELVTILNIVFSVLFTVEFCIKV